MSVILAIVTWHFIKSSLMLLVFFSRCCLPTGIYDISELSDLHQQLDFHGFSSMDLFYFVESLDCCLEFLLLTLNHLRIVNNWILHSLATCQMGICLTLVPKTVQCSNDIRHCGLIWILYNCFYVNWFNNYLDTI